MTSRKKDDKVRLSLALDESWEARLEQCADRIGHKKHALAQAAVEALVRAIEAEDYRVVLPVEFFVTHVSQRVGGPSVPAVRAAREKAAAHGGTPEVRDKREVAEAIARMPGNMRPIPVFGLIPAGMPDPAEGGLEPLEYVGIPRSRLPEATFALRVFGESMNASTPRPINDGDIVLMADPARAEIRAGRVVAALIDQQTTLMRLRQDRTTGEYYLASESHNPEFGAIRAAGELSELTIQGVMVGKL